MACLLLLLGAAMNLFLPALQSFQIEDCSYDAQRHVLTALGRLEADLSESRLAWLHITANYVAIPTPRDNTDLYHTDASTGLPDWQGWIVYDLVPDPSNPGTKNLLRHIEYPVPFAVPLTGYVPQGGGLPRLVAGGVTAFSLVTIPVPQHLSVNVSLSTSRTFQGRSTTFRGEKTVELFY